MPCLRSYTPSYIIVTIYPSLAFSYLPDFRPFFLLRFVQEPIEHSHPQVSLYFRCRRHFHFRKVRISPLGRIISSRTFRGRASIYCCKYCHLIHKQAWKFGYTSSHTNQRELKKTGDVIIWKNWSYLSNLPSILKMLYNFTNEILVSLSICDDFLTLKDQITTQAYSPALVNKKES